MDRWVDDYKESQIYVNDNGYFWAYNEIESDVLGSITECKDDFDLYIENNEAFD